MSLDATQKESHDRPLVWESDRQSSPYIAIGRVQIPYPFLTIAQMEVVIWIRIAGSWAWQ
jgi:hypothetical protein